MINFLSEILQVRDTGGTFWKCQKTRLSTWNFILSESIFQKWRQNKDFFQAYWSWKFHHEHYLKWWNKSKKLETGQMSISAYMNKPWYIHTIECYLLIKKKWAVDAWYNMNESQSIDVEIHLKNKNN